MARPKNFYATTRFSVQDILALRPDWTDKQARDFLSTNEDGLMKAMSDAGTAAIEDFLAAVAD